MRKKIAKNAPRPEKSIRATFVSQTHRIVNPSSKRPFSFQLFSTNLRCYQQHVGISLCDQHLIQTSFRSPFEHCRFVCPIIHSTPSLLEHALYVTVPRCASAASNIKQIPAQVKAEPINGGFDIVYPRTVRAFRQTPATLRCRPVHGPVHGVIRPKHLLVKF